ncbi:MAG: AraC family transcriptional regulator [Alphaproteobacteria bacterium]|nr:AraC family transcriptional regulator [Alphaproteobacteria bacterium]
MLKEFTTDTITATRQLPAWREIMSDVYYSVDIVRPEQHLRGKIREVEIENLSFTRFDSDHQRVLRTRSKIAQDPDDSYVFIMPQREKMFYSQLGRTGFVTEGDYILVSTSEFYELSCPDNFINYTVKLQGQRLRERIPNIDDHLCCRFPMNREMAQIAICLAAKSAATLASSPSAHAAALACRIEDFIAMVVEYEDTSDAGQEKRARFLLRQRISQYIRSKIEDQDLTPREIALRLGISVSYLHRVFNEHGTTVSAYIMDQRLNLAYERLASANGLRATVAEVAYSTGFKNPSHFCKAFAGRYNKAPSDVRPKSM